MTKTVETIGDIAGSPPRCRGQSTSEPLERQVSYGRSTRFTRSWRRLRHPLRHSRHGAGQTVQSHAGPTAGHRNGWLLCGLGMAAQAAGRTAPGATPRAGGWRDVCGGDAAVRSIRAYGRTDNCRDIHRHRPASRGCGPRRDLDGRQRLAGNAVSGAEATAPDYFPAATHSDLTDQGGSS